MGKFYQNLSKLETPDKSWKGTFQTNVQIKKLHKPFYFKKTKWLVLSKKGNIYLFNKPDSTEINSIFSMKDFQCNLIKTKFFYLMIDINLNFILKIMN